MIKTLKLTNFKKHTALSLNFTKGLNLIKAANEQGKSSAIEAISYALFGARALKSSLADTVTDGNPESSLRVEMEFEQAGVTYLITRSKSGARLSGGGSSSEGHAEVTAAVERLMRFDGNAASLLMFASQSSLRGALEMGATAASSLIEDLADLSTLDDWIQKIQDQLPSGNTKHLEELVLNFEAMWAPALDDAVEREAVVQAEVKEAQILASVKASEACLPDIKSLSERLAKATSDVAQTKADLAKLLLCEQIVAKPIPPEPDVAGLELRAEKQISQAALYNKYVDYTLLPKSDVKISVLLTQTPEAYLQELALEVSKLTHSITTTQDAKFKLSLKLIQEDCSLCGKSVSEVPEVVFKNKQVQKALDDLTTTLAVSNGLLEAEKLELQVVKEAVNLASNLRVLTKHLPVEPDDSYPPTYKWVGGQVDAVPDTENYSLQLKHAREVSFARRNALEALSGAQATLALGGALKCRQRLSGASIFLEECKNSLDSATYQQDCHKRLLETLHKAKVSSLSAVYDLEAKTNTYNYALARYADSRVQLGVARSKLSATVKNNLLIKKLKDSRPVVAKHLWFSTLSLINHYFSKVRGVPTCVTRSDKGFLVDGKSYSRLSGSTQDALGLAIRVALVKTFLPNCSFMVLDEPASACDSDRELSMLSMLAGSGFDQVLMVSHSDVADAFAANLITL